MQSAINIGLQDILNQSNLYTDQENTPVPVLTAGVPLSNNLIKDVGEVLTNIMFEFPITDFQKCMLTHIFNEFDLVRRIIDPYKLKPFSYSYTNDEELLLTRESDNGITTIILNSEECIAFSYIPYSGQRKLYFIKDENGDFEKLAYNFFSH